MFTKKSAAESILQNTKKIYTDSHEYRIVDFAEFPHLDGRFYEDTMNKIESFGFRHVADVENLTVKEGMFDPRAVLRIGLSFDGSVASVHYQIKPRFWWRVLFWFTKTKTGKTTEFETEFEDGSFVATSNANNALLLDNPPQIFSEYLPETSPVEAIEARHRERLTEHCAVKTTSPRQHFSLKDILESQHRMEKIRAEFRERVGWVKKSEWDRLAVNPNEATDALYQEFTELREERERSTS